MISKKLKKCFELEYVLYTSFIHYVSYPLKSINKFYNKIVNHQQKLQVDPGFVDTP